jgi:hypothetical protein
MVEGQEPPRSRPAEVSRGKRPSSFLVPSSGVSLPLVGVTTSICWVFNTMEVRANHLPVSFLVREYSACFVLYADVTLIFTLPGT